jgi:uncharacterized protein YneF (UPF0154 family)
MARKEFEVVEEPIGPQLMINLLRLGFADIVVRSSELANLVSEKTGKTMSRQRISQMMNAVRVEPETIETLAKALGVKPSELVKKTRLKFE